MKLFFKDQAFSFELLRAVSYADYQGAEIGECLATAAKIQEGNFESWYKEWGKLAQRIEIIGENCIHNNHIVSGREALLRASNYYRTAEFFLKGDDERSNKIYSKSVLTFQKAMKHMPIYCEDVEIPYEGSYMKGYFLRADDYEQNKTPRSTLVFIGGFDSTAEELYFCGAAPAIKRGYNCLIFDGPGQGETLRIQKLPTRYDYEVPVGKAIDYLEGRMDVDTEKIVLMGMSMGGYYAPRAAAFEKRIKACVAYDIYYDLFDSVPLLKKVEKLPKGVIDSIAHMAGRKNSGLRWAIQNALWVFDLKHIYEICEEFKKYSLKNIAQQIECPILVLVGEKDHFVPYEQVEQFSDQLKCKKTFRVFKTEEGAEEHCQEGNMALVHQVIFDWIDCIFSNCSL